jgi:phytoene dehydrogenase-like protein
MVDAVVVGAGHNGLVGADLLADAGWQVLVLEATDQPAGSVRTAELTVPGFRSEVFGAFLALGRPRRSWAGSGWRSTAWRGSRRRWGWPTPQADGRCGVLSRDLAETAAS